MTAAAGAMNHGTSLGAYRMHLPTGLAAQSLT